MTPLYIICSFVGFLRTLLILILISYVIKMVFRILAPYLLKRFMAKMAGQGFQQPQQEKQQRDSRSKVGDVTITGSTKKRSSDVSNKKIDDSDEEYVDFEEV